MAPSAFTLLHLSDLHFAAPQGSGHYWNSEATELQLAAHDRRGLLGSLVRDLRQQNVAPDLVVVTGDLLDRSSVLGVPMAIEFLKELCARLELPRRRVVLVPGNHDVRQQGEPAERYALFEQIWQGFYGDEWPGFPTSTPAHLRVRHFDFSDELGVEVVGFNSCEALDPARNQEYGSVGTAQRDRAEELLEANRGKALFRIAAMHHHLGSPAGKIRDDLSMMADAPLTLLWLMRQRFHLVLHGHQHVDWQVVHQEQVGEENWLLTLTAAGSAGVAGYGRNEWQLQLGYQVIGVEDGTTGWRRRREYDPQRREWIDAGRDDARRELEFGARAGGRTAAGPPSALSDLPEPCLQRVLELVSSPHWPRPVLEGAYLASAPTGWGHEFDSDEGEGLARRMLLRLHNAIWQSDRTHPFLTFVRHLVEIANDPRSPPELLDLYRHLSRWFEEASTALGLGAEWRQALSARVNEDRQRLKALELHVILSIARSLSVREQFIVHAWRALVSSASTTWADEDVLPLEVPGGEGPYSLAELPRRVMALLEQDALDKELLNANGNLTLSLFVPVELLGCTADRWEVEMGLESSPLGAEYNVVVRSWERAYDRKCTRIVPKWRERWARLQAAPERAVCQYGPEHASGDGAELRGPAEDLACAVLPFAPDSGDSGSPILRRLISLGIPIAIWPREAPRDETRLRQFLAALSSRNPLRTWREDVRAFRREATSPEHPGSHLTLLWDDPHKLPPDALGWARFTSPVKPEDTKS